MLWPTELPRHDVRLDWEAGHDPAPPAWTASTLPAYATPSCLWSERHDSNVHEPSDSAALEAAAAPISPRPDGSDERSRRREKNARPLTYQVSALAGAELRRLGAGGRIRTCSAPKRVTIWAWCVYLFRHAGNGSPVSDSNRRSAG